MMRFFYFLLLLLPARTSLAATYYLAANGDDTRTAAQAQSPATPWQSLARLNAAMPALLPGDQVLFRRGDVFRGQLVISCSGTSGAPIVFGAYGAATSALPVLSSSIPLSGWANAGPNLWEAPCPAGAAVTGLYAANGKALPLGRYPNPTATNKGYLPISAHTGNTSLSTPQLAGSWAGATAVVRSIRWVLDRAPVTGQTGTTLALGAFENPSYTNGGIPNGWGFFLQNHPATLDQPGEWYYYPARGVLRLYASAAPANSALLATPDQPAGIVIRNQQYLTLENLTIARAPRQALLATNVAHLLMRGVQIVGADENGMVLTGTGSDVVVENSLIRGVNNNAVDISGYTDVVFRNNTLRNNATVAGRGRSGDGQYYTFGISDGDRITLTDNALDSCGYVGMAYFRVSNINITRNVVSNFCLVKDDGGGIYTFNGGSPANNLDARIENNIVLHGIGAPEGTNDLSYVPVYGIYLDDCTRNATVINNTVAECRWGGIFMHGNRNVNVSYNHLYDNGAQLVIAGAGACTSVSHTVQHNILVGTGPDKLAADYHVPTPDLSLLGMLSNNIYAQPFADAPYLHYEYRTYLLSEWQALSGLDARSTDGPVHYRPFQIQRLTGAEKVSNNTFDNNVQGWGYWASSGSAVINWDNTNALGSGGSLRLLSPRPPASGAGAMQAQSAVGAVQQAATYLLRFSARCASGSKLLEVFLQQSTPPYADLTPSRQVVALGPTARSYELALPAKATDATALLTFQAAEDNNAVWLDNVTLREALLTPARTTDSVRLEYNASPVPRTVQLPAATRFVDAYNSSYSGSFVLAPYTSVILFSLKGSPLSNSHTPVRLTATISPNPTTGLVELDLRAWPMGTYQIKLLDAQGRLVMQYALSGGSIHTLDMGRLASGLYLLQGQEANAQLNQRIVKE